MTIHSPLIRLQAARRNYEARRALACTGTWSRTVVTTGAAARWMTLARNSAWPQGVCQSTDAAAGLRRCQVPNRLKIRG